MSTAWMSTAPLASPSDLGGFPMWLPHGWSVPVDRHLGFLPEVLQIRGGMPFTVKHPATCQWALLVYHTPSGLCLLIWAPTCTWHWSHASLLPQGLCAAAEDAGPDAGPRLLRHLCHGGEVSARPALCPIGAALLAEPELAL